MTLVIGTQNRTGPKHLVSGIPQFIDKNGQSAVFIDKHFSTTFFTNFFFEFEIKFAASN
jgi:hypothetical protein